MTQTIVPILSLAVALLSVFVASGSIFISSRLSFRNNVSAYRKQIKIDCFRRFFASRYDFHSTEFKFAINEIFVSFNDNSEIQIQSQKLQRLAASKGIANADLLDLIKLMIVDCNLEKLVDDDFLLSPFRVDP